MISNSANLLLLTAFKDRHGGITGCLNPMTTKDRHDRHPQDFNIQNQGVMIDIMHIQIEFFFP